MSILQSCDLCTYKRGKPNHQCYSVMDLMKLYWYLTHVERTVRNGNGISADVIDDYSLENDEKGMSLLL